MCQGLRPLQQSISTYAGQFDARKLTSAQAGEVVRLCAQIEASAASIKALAATRVAECKTWKDEGYRSASEQLAAQAGMSPSAAKRALDTGRRLADQPDVAAAALAGDLSLEQATAISDGVAADPTKAAELIAKARHSSLPELNDEVAIIKSAASDQEQRRRARHAKRALRRWTDRDGIFQAHLTGHPEDGARLWRMLDPIRRRLNVLRRESGEPNESLDTLDYDALMTMAAIATGQEKGELTLADLVELGLFPQLDATTRRTSDLPDLPDARAPQAGRSNPSTPTAGTDPDLFSTLDGTDADPTESDPTDADPTDADPTDADEIGLSSTADPIGLSTADPDSPSGAESKELDLSSTTEAADGTDVEPLGTDSPSPSKPSRNKKLAGSPIRVMIRVDLDALLRGVARKGELCEIAGYGPVPISVIEHLLATENPFIIGILTKAQALVGVYHHGRHPNSHQRSALDFLYPTCAAQGCSSRNGLQYDHRLDYAKTHYTAFDLLDRLCKHHHAKKTHDGWALIEGHGKRPFVPPHDPRHPGQAPSAPDPPP